MKETKTLVLTGYGINCDYETKHAFELAGSTADRVHLNELIENPRMLEDYQIFFVPGGFSYGDELGAGKVLANKLMFNLGERLIQFVKDGYLVGGHCNGAQVLVKTGLLPAINSNYGVQTATLTNNNTNRYEDRWVTVKSISDKCIWTKGLPLTRVAVAHGEGKFYTEDESLIEKLKANDQIALVYAKPDGSPANGEFPLNPNGSIDDIAGICDPTGRVFLQMPHHERYINLMNHPQWTRIKDDLLDQGLKIDDINWDGEGLSLFKNTVDYAIEELV